MGQHLHRYRLGAEIAESTSRCVRRDRSRRDPIVPGISFHGLRHSHKTWMQEDEIQEFVQDKRLGHSTIGIGIGARYSHITPSMIANLLTNLETRY